MTPKTKLMAIFYRASYARMDPVEVACEQHAITMGLAEKAFFFETYEIPTLTLDGRTYTAPAENHSGRRFVGVEELAKAPEAADHYELRLASPVRNRAEYSPTYRDRVRELITEYRQDTELKDSFVREQYPCVDYVRLKEGDKAFDRNGVQIWPQP